MTNSNSRLRAVSAALTVSALSVAGLWLWAVPAVLSPSTFAFIAVFMIGGATVSLISWRNGQATITVGQVLHATEVAPATAAGTARHTSA